MASETQEKPTKERHELYLRTILDMIVDWTNQVYPN